MKNIFYTANFYSLNTTEPFKTNECSTGDAILQTLIKCSEETTNVYEEETENLQKNKR